MEARSSSCCVFRIRLAILGRVRAGRIDTQFVCGSLHSAVRVWRLVPVFLVPIRTGSLRYPVGSSYGLALASIRQPRTLKSREVCFGVALCRDLVPGARAGSNERAKW